MKIPIDDLLVKGRVLAPIELVRAFEETGLPPMLIWETLLRMSPRLKNGQ